jgi:hypothetical protein
VPVQKNRAAGGQEQGGQHFDAGGFSRAVGSEKAEYFPPGHGKGNVIDCGEIAEFPRQLFNLNDGAFHGPIKHKSRFRTKSSIVTICKNADHARARGRLTGGLRFTGGFIFC